MRWILVVIALLWAAQVDAQATRPATAARLGSVIFIHPDGTTDTHYTAARLLHKGSDGMLNWDALPAMALYRGHMLDALAATSHSGATVHAYGVKVPIDSYGMHGERPLIARSGKAKSIMQEASEAGIATGVVNSGTIIEPGTGVFLASVRSRRLFEEIALQHVESSADVIFAGGEEWMLPAGVQGRHGPGKRTDGQNLIELAVKKGFTVIYTRDQLQKLPAETPRVLGLFAAADTYNDRAEEVLRELKLPLYQPDAPTVAEMTEAALRVLSRGGGGFCWWSKRKAPTTSQTTTTPRA